MTNPTPIREGRDVVHYAFNHRVVVRRFKNGLLAEIYRRRLIDTDWGNKGNPNN